MILDEVAALLKVLAAYDGRTIGEADVMVWGRQMADVELRDAIEAVHDHYGETREWAYPSDIRRLAERHRNRRHRRPEVVAPGCFEPDPEARRRLTPSDDGLRALPAADDRPLTDRTEELREFVAGVRGTLPEGDPDQLRYGHRHWRQTQTAWKRQQTAEPNPHYNPNLGVIGEVPALPDAPEAWWVDERARERHATRLLAEAGRLTRIDGDVA